VKYFKIWLRWRGWRSQIGKFPISTAGPFEVANPVIVSATIMTNAPYAVSAKLNNPNRTPEVWACMGPETFYDITLLAVVFRIVSMSQGELG
jgi:hypothetical protein